MHYSKLQEEYFAAIASAQANEDPELTAAGGGDDHTRSADFEGLLSAEISSQYSGELLSPSGTTGYGFPRPMQSIVYRPLSASASSEISDDDVLAEQQADESSTEPPSPSSSAFQIAELNRTASSDPKAGDLPSASASFELGDSELEDWLPANSPRPTALS
jgi:hypothetical protein